MEKTLVLIKPDAVERNINGEIISYFEKKSLKVVALKLIHLSKEMAQKHYAVHAGKSFYTELVDYISSAPIVAMVLEGENAIEAARQIMGATDPAKSEKGTIRGDFGLDIGRNSVHGSDGPQTAESEIKLFFGGLEIFD